MDNHFANSELLAARAASGTGGNRGQGSSSLSAFLCTLVPLLVLNAVYITLFLIFRRKYRRIYEPRSYLGSIRNHSRTPATSPGFLSWVKDFYRIPDEYVLNHQSLDGYLYLRFYKMLFVITFVGALITWPILFPVYATAGGGKTQFNTLSFSNVVNTPNRFYASTFIAYIYLGFVMLVIARETLYYIHLRQAYLLSPRIASRLSSRTVIFTDVPKHYLEEERVRATFPEVKQVWFATDCKDLEKLISKERDKTAMKLEAAIVKLSKAAHDQSLKARKKDEPFPNPLQWVDENKRPTHKLKPLIGQKVDTLDWCRDHLHSIIPQVEEMQALHWSGKATRIPAMFVEFETVQAAQSAYQGLVYHTPKKLQARAVGVTPDQVMWKSLNVPWWRRELLYAAATALVCLLILCWSPITAFIGFVSNVNYLSSYAWLHWITSIPKVILGVITGLLPSVLLAVVVALVPIIMKLFAKFAGAISTGEVELMVQSWYFWFQVIIVFLLTTFTSGASAVIETISSDPTKAPSLLAQNLPTASNFYISYFIVFGVGTSAQMIFNVVSVLVYLVLGALLDKTPRKKFKRYIQVPGISWGSNYPKYTTLGVIAIAYSTIAPLILGFAAVGLLLLYVAFRYELIYTLETTNADTQGASYGKALQQLTTGVYLSEICMIGLFAIHCGSSGAAAGPLILMIIFLVITILFHLAMLKALKPFTRGLPADLLAESTRKMATASQLESGEINHHSFLGQSDKTITNGTRAALINGEASATLSPPPDAGFFKRLLFKFMHPSAMPEFADYLSQPLPEYSNESRREAYLDPAITSATPLLWIVHDELGVSDREKAETSNVAVVSDAGAWWAVDTGKMTLLWEGAGEEEGEKLREVPVWEDKAEY